jgi:hypothetical protein
MDYMVSEKWGQFLATRERGRKVREDIETHLSKVRAGDALVLNFIGVEGITVSFGDECVAKLILSRSSGDFADRGLAIGGANEDVRETLEAVLSRRKFSAVLITESDVEIIGQDDLLSATLKEAVQLKTFSAADIADRLGITVQAANNRLKQLVATGSVVRERVVPDGGGKEFSYSVVIPTYA